LIRVLAIFSNPTESARLSLDREDKALVSLSRQYSDCVFLDRQPASDIDDIHWLISNNIYDIIHFSGHGDKNGIILEKCGSPGTQEFYSAMQIVHLLDLAPRPPTVVIFLCCFSSEYADTLCKAAPFVITTDESVYDSECIQFVTGFYEKFFESQSVTSSFTHGINLLRAKNLYRDVFRLFRRELLIKSDSMFIECKPRTDRDTIIINLDPVAEKLDKLGATREEILHLISRKLSIHYWIFEGARDDALIPIGSLLFGSFSWKNSADVVICNDLVRLASGGSDKHWQLGQHYWCPITTWPHVRIATSTPHLIPRKRQFWRTPYLYSNTI
jgi:hypothetical protein